MKNRLGLLGAWLVATTLAVGVASQAVGLVADRAVEIPVQVPIAVVDQSSIGPIGTPSTPPPIPDPLPTPTTTTTPPASTTSTSAGTGATTTTTMALATTTTTTTPAATTTTIPLDSGSFLVEGGQVSAACTGPSTITMLGTVPVTGWRTDVESSGPEKVKVEFGMGEEEFDVEIVCVNGLLQADIED